MGFAGPGAKYRISEVLEVEVRQLFKGGNYSREETIVFILFRLNEET